MTGRGNLSAARLRESESGYRGRSLRDTVVSVADCGGGSRSRWQGNCNPHTITSQGAGDLSSGSIDAGASWRYTFTEAGSFQYYCTFHPEMKGTVVVK